MNWLERYFYNNPGRLIHKWLHYFDIYHRHFAPFRRKKITILEIGVYQGGSLQMWRKYFGRKARIYGVDIDDRTVALGGRDATVIVGDQADRIFLRELVARIGPIDIVIDDGGHTMDQQIVSFEELWPAVVDGGVYLVEDLHTNYWEEFGGGFGRDDTFIEYAKRLIDQQHAWYSRDERLVVDESTRSIRGMHVYDSIIVFDKAVVAPPRAEMTGEPVFPLLDDR